MITVDEFKLLDDVQCGRVIAAGLASRDYRGGRMKDSDGQDYVAPNIRQSSVAFLEPEELGDIATILREKAEHLNDQVFKAELSGKVQYQFASYEGSKGDFIAWHADEPLWDNKWRGKKVSMCTQLSDPVNYDGGVFEIRERPPTRRGLGLTVAFPSFIWHRVTPVTRGWRFAIVTWLHGAHWR